MSISVRHLTKRFGSQNAVDNISFEAKSGEILGFLGPNGAGKSTTMKIATTYLPPTSGTVTVGGFDIQEDPLEVRRIVGYLPEHNPLYYDMYVREYLGFVASLFKTSKKINSGRIEEMIRLTGLTSEAGKKIGHLSKGYKQRVGLAQSMIHDPDILILDEPTSGLDPNQIVEIRNLIRELSKNKTVIFSTHIMQEVQALCDRVVIISNGRIVADDMVENLKSKSTGQQIIIAEFQSIPDLIYFENLAGKIDLKTEGNTLKIYAEADVDIRSTVFKIASDNQLPLVGLSRQDQSMEDIFHQLTVNKEEK